MKKYSFIPVILILTLILCSCGVENMRLYDDDATYAQNTVSRLVSALKERDNDMLKSLFSNKVNSEVSELDDQTAELFEFIQGKIVSNTDPGDIGIGSSLHQDHGKRKISLKYSITLETDTDKYYLAIFEIRRDDFNDSNKGIESLYIINVNDWQKEYTFGIDGEGEKIGISIVDSNYDPLSQSEQDIDPQVADMVDHYKNQDR